MCICLYACACEVCLRKGLHLVQACAAACLLYQYVCPCVHVYACMHVCSYDPFPAPPSPLPPSLPPTLSPLPPSLFLFLFLWLYRSLTRSIAPHSHFHSVNIGRRRRWRRGNRVRGVLQTHGNGFCQSA